MTDVETLVAELVRLREQVREQAIEAARERAQADAVINRLSRDVDVLREEAHEMRLWAEEAARAENANAEDAKKERAAVVEWLKEVAEDPETLGMEARILRQVAEVIAQGGHRK